MVMIITAQELHLLLEKELKDVLVIDCRSFFAYNVSHIVNAQNVHCPSIVRRRVCGSLPLENILTYEHTRGKARSGKFKTIVIYDDTAGSKDWKSDTSIVSLVLSGLIKENMQIPIVILEDGFETFQSLFHDQCESCHVPNVHDPSTCPTPREEFYTPCEGTPVLEDRIKYQPAHDEGDPKAILPWLYIGSINHASQQDRLQQLGISALLNMATEQQVLLQQAPCPDLRCKHIPVDDSQTSDISPWFPEAIDFIESVRHSGGKVLVHCRAGVSRSASVCIAYIMWLNNWTLEQSYQYLKCIRSQIAPNLNFMTQLAQFEVELASGRRFPSSSSSTSSSSYTSAPDTEGARITSSSWMTSPVFSFESPGTQGSTSCNLSPMLSPS